MLDKHGVQGGAGGRVTRDEFLTVVFLPFPADRPSLFGVAVVASQLVDDLARSPYKLGNIRQSVLAVVFEDDRGGFFATGLASGDSLLDVVVDSLFGPANPIDFVVFHSDKEDHVSDLAELLGNRLSTEVKEGVFLTIVPYIDVRDADANEWLITPFEDGFRNPVINEGDFDWYLTVVADRYGALDDSELSFHGGYVVLLCATKP